MSKYYIIAGEASGDLHASNLMKEIALLDGNASFRCWGGDLMQNEGGIIVKHYRDLAFMGFVEVLFNLKTILKNLKFCKSDILSYNPDALILVDYPGFNLRIAEFAKAHNIPVHYYISPQVWAWKENRVEKIKKWVDYMYVILPFEKEFYHKHHFEVNFVGHPLIDAVENFKKHAKQQNHFIAEYGLNDKPIISLLPGSRKQEVAVKLPIMLAVVDKFKDYQFIIGAAPSLPIEFYEEIIGAKPVKVIYNDTYNLLNNSHTALVTSGTATLETALFNVPQVVCYKGSAISYHIIKRLIKIKFISLVNLIADKSIVKELIQHDLTPANLESELSVILTGQARTEMLIAYSELKNFCGGRGASQNTAKALLKTLDTI